MNHSTSSSVQVGSIGLTLPDTLSREDWLSIGVRLGRAERGVMWEIGEWWNFAEHRYGDRAALVRADDWDGPAFQTCVNAGNVAQRFKGNRRRLSLSFSHHAEVAALPSQEADTLL